MHRRRTSHTEPTARTSSRTSRRTPSSPEPHRPDAPAIEAIGLRKSFGPVRVLTGVDLQVERGEVFSLLGPNGAGKTTTVRILATLTAPDGGLARVAGRDVVAERAAVRRVISLTGQFAAVDEKQTAEENLRMMARLSGLSRPAARRRAAELLERFDLTAAARRRAQTYSGGMRRRLDLAAGLVGEPEVIFLDEPTTGLDPRSRAGLWEVVRELSAAGSTVFLTTQYLEEADRLADRIALVDGGRLIAQGSADELKARVSGHRLDLVAAGPEAYLRIVSRVGPEAGRPWRPWRRPEGAAQAGPVPAHEPWQPRQLRHSPDSLTLALPTDGGADEVRALLDRADPERCDVVRFSVERATLDDVFLALTGREAAPHQETAHV
ncbi:daunorubicin resistance protein DrrA family ABC transporter ATP-binding protein [Streptomyces inusitatus]|uniref:ABC-type xenobiotic transporter n=1 Tax=Streptomyces inusitatus TaxID=68221 RepID=A0A918V3A8_9ACTN|nr:ATP-binding cassette domain-containing protein [Streptomyces inusitatus]GGZ58119.1 daunorubicin resistance protein DrrA family ABC transporter ATP-binding protein [Streptomyces inusitatus]